MKIIWGINIPYQSTKIDFDATERKRKELEAQGEHPSFMECRVVVPCIRKKDFFFEMCEFCGGQVTGGRLKRGWKSCSKECHDKVGSAWAHHTKIMEREQTGKRPVYFWFEFRHECFERDNYICQSCRCDVREHIKRGFNPPEAHHIIPISKGGSNKLSNLKTLCYDCHKEEHSRIGKIKRQHKPLIIE